MAGPLIKRNGLLMMRQGLLQVRAVLPGGTRCCCPSNLGGLCCDFQAEAVPTPLTGTIESPCAEIDGDTFTLTFTNGMGITPSRTQCWQGMYSSGVTNCPRSDDITLCCCETGGVGDIDQTCRSLCLDFPSFYADGCVIRIDNNGFPVACSCDPLEFVFAATITEPSAGMCLCCPVVGAPVTIRITE